MTPTAAQLAGTTNAQAPAAGSAIPAAVLLGLALLYLPIYFQLASTLWQQQEYSHAPLIAVASAYLVWRERAVLSALPAPRYYLSGALIFACGLLLAWLGQTQALPLVATISQLPVLAGCVLVLHGRAGLRVIAFPLLFLLFMVPLPGMLVDTLTLPLKEGISAIAVQLLHGAGYAVARSGVIIVMGPYQMLVADACSGLHSLISLSALGLLYSHQQRDQPRVQRLLMIAAIVPIAIAANLLRTVALLLITYHAGDVAARAWHEATGLVLFLLALLMLFATNHLLTRCVVRRNP